MDSFTLFLFYRISVSGEAGKACSLGRSAVGNAGFVSVVVICLSARQVGGDCYLFFFGSRTDTHSGANSVIISAGCFVCIIAD